MPKRNLIERVPTLEAQGEDSWIEISRPLWGEIRVMRQDSQHKDFDNIQASIELINKHLIAWNWVDEHGEPLPQPKDLEAPTDIMTDIELRAVSDIFARTLEQKKSEAPPS